LTSNLSKAHETRDSLSSFCSHVVFVYFQPFLHNTLLIIDVDTIKKLATSARYEVNISASICKRFHATQANSGKMTTFRE